MNKKASLITLVLCGAILLSLSAAFFIVPDRAVSPVENRDLAQMPVFTAESFFSGEFGNGINEYFADQFPLRDSFTSLKAYCELALLKGENNGVLFSASDLAVRDFNAFDGKNRDSVPSNRYYEKVIDAITKSLTDVKSKFDEANITFAVCVPPRAVDVKASAYAYPKESSEELMAKIASGLANAGYADTYNILEEKYREGEYVYYRTDHHWTSLGAYYAYCEIMKSFGMGDAVLPLDSFERETLSTDFRGTSSAKSGFTGVKADVITLYKSPVYKDLTVTRADGRSIDGLIDRAFLDEYDKYSAFLGGDDTEVRITAEEARPKLLMVKDSFGLSLAPFLACHFDIVLTDVSARRNITEQASALECEYVLVVYNAENFITSADGAMLNR